jgi:general secretion pathway protein I
MSRRELGFSLLEILVAFVILALAMGVIMRIFSGALNNIGTADHHAHAALVAESVLDSLGVETPLTEGEQSGDDGQGYRWHALISRYVDQGAVLEDQSNPVVLYQIALDVNWGAEGTNVTGLHLTTLRTAVKP